MTGTDIAVLLEAFFIIVLPLCIVATGVFLRRKFPKPAAGPDGTAGQEPGASKAARTAGHLLFWGGIFAALFAVTVILNFKGIL